MGNMQEFEVYGKRYAQASDTQRAAVAAVFQNFTDLGIVALFSLSYVLGGVWWLGIGMVLQVERRILGIVTALQGIVTVAYGIGTILQVEPLAMSETLTFFAPSGRYGSASSFGGAPARARKGWKRQRLAEKRGRLC